MIAKHGNVTSTIHPPLNAVTEKSKQPTEYTQKKSPWSTIKGPNTTKNKNSHPRDHANAWITISTAAAHGDVHQQSIPTHNFLSIAFLLFIIFIASHPRNHANAWMAISMVTARGNARRRMGGGHSISTIERAEPQSARICSNPNLLRTRLGCSATQFCLIAFQVYATAIQLYKGC